MDYFFVERCLSSSLIMEMNKKSRTYKGKMSKMFIRVKEIDEISDNPNNINLEKNIILCTPSHLNIFKQNIDGTFSLNLIRDENLSSGKTTGDGAIGILDYSPYVKMCIPQGIKVNIDDPSFGFCFIEKIYPYCEMYYQDEKEKDSKNISFNEIPSYVIMTDFKITFHVDLRRLRNTHGSFLLKTGQSIANIYFTELPHFKEFGKELDKIIYIRNTEIYDQFINIF